MKIPAYVPALAVVALAAFAVGRLTAERPAGASAAGRRVLYYVDPMHPAYRSDRPGTAPDCGMALEAVYEGDDPLAHVALPPGAVSIDSQRQRMIGVRTERVVSGPGRRRWTTTGRVQADPARVRQLTAAVGGWVQSLGVKAEGSFVRRDEVLAVYYSRELRAAEQSYLSGLSGAPWRGGAARDSVETAWPNTSSLSQSEELLRSLGMSEAQLRDIARTHQLTGNIQVVSPIDGVLLERPIAAEQRFDRGAPLARVADLSRVWILADLYGDEARGLRAGTRVEVHAGELGRRFTARVSAAPPAFDPATRTFKLRLEVDNPAGALRPEMYVDLELEATMPAVPTVPASAVLDRGRHSVVFVQGADGVFEPRTVVIGETVGDRLTIRHGLAAGDRVVTAGTFLLDSESRMRGSSAERDEDEAEADAPGMTAARGGSSRDAVCGMTVDSLDAVRRGTVRRQGVRNYVFCSARCAARFDAQPAAFTTGR